jgi:hypothetical protein
MQRSYSQQLLVVAVLVISSAPETPAALAVEYNELKILAFFAASPQHEPLKSIYLKRRCFLIEFFFSINETFRYLYLLW